MPTFYEILEIDSNADSTTIRKAYLKASLKHHPDKNPNNIEEAKAKFVQIGQAYETLSDPQKRAIYDRELRSGRTSSSSSSNYDYNNYSSTSNNTNNNSSSNNNNYYYAGAAGAAGAAAASSFADAYYENYRDAFDATVAGMSEEELAAAIGTATAIASIVGSMVGSRMMAHGTKSRGGGGGGAGAGILTAAGSVVGSMVAQEMAASSIRALHQQSIERLAYKEECRRCQERGQPLPDPPRSMLSNNKKVEQIFSKAVDTFKGVANNETTKSTISNFWNIAKEGVKQAAEAAAAGKQPNNNNNNYASSSSGRPSTTGAGGSYYT